MDRTRPDRWEIAVGWEVLDAGSEEERACFATLGLRAYDTWLTEGHDAIANRLRQAPYLSAYHLAEWLACGCTAGGDGPCGMNNGYLARRRRGAEKCIKTILSMTLVGTRRF